MLCTVIHVMQPVATLQHRFIAKSTFHHQLEAQFSGLTCLHHYLLSQSDSRQWLLQCPAGQRVLSSQRCHIHPEGQPQLAHTTAEHSQPSQLACSNSTHCCLFISLFFTWGHGWGLIPNWEQVPAKLDISWSRSAHRWWRWLQSCLMQHRDHIHLPQKWLSSSKASLYQHVTFLQNGQVWKPAAPPIKSASETKCSKEIVRKQQFKNAWGMEVLCISA